MPKTMDTVTALCYGEVLWDVLPSGAQPGGAPLNVAYHLNKLGIETGIVSRVGHDLNGERLVGLMDKWGINLQFLQVDHEHPTSRVLTKMNGNEVSYDIIFPVAWDYIERDRTILPFLGVSTYLIFGSLASRNDVSRKTLMKLLDQEAIKVFDINLRPPFIGRELLAVLLQRANIVKLNQAELEMVQIIFGGPLSNEASQVNFILEEFDIAEIIITKGEFGASYYTRHRGFHLWGNEVKVADTIGSGDSFLAAFIASHHSKLPPEKTLKNAIAMGAFIATKKGGCPEYQVEEYENFKNQMF